MAQRGITVRYEAIRLWCNKFGSKYAQRLTRKQQGYGDTLFIGEVLIKTQGTQHYLWRAVDQDGGVVDVFHQEGCDGKAAKHFFKSLLLIHKGEPCKIVTDRLRSYNVAQGVLIPESIHANPVRQQ
jgi:putative transposase